MIIPPSPLQEGEEDELRYRPSDQTEDADFEHGRVFLQNPSRANPLDPLATSIKALDDLPSMSGPDFLALVSDLPLPTDARAEGTAEGTASRQCLPVPRAPLRCASVAGAARAPAPISGQARPGQPLFRASPPPPISSLLPPCDSQRAGTVRVNAYKQ